MPVVAALLALLLMPLSGAVRAADIITVEDECNGRHLVLQGPIEPGDYQRFVDAMAQQVAGERPAVQDPDVLWTVELDGPGGDLAEAQRIGRFLREAFATTEVAYRYARRPDGVWDFARGGELVCLDGAGRLSGCEADLVEAQCSGACLLVWLGGATRHATAGQLGLHGLAGDPALDEYLTELGVPPRWRERIASTGSNETGWLDWPERHQLAGRAAALQALVAECPAPLTRDESYRSVTAASASERDALMARAEAHRSCRRARLAEARAELTARLAQRARAGRDALAARGRN